MPRATSQGVQALANIVEREGLIKGEQYFGMVMDNMTLKDPKFQTAVEVAAQNALFHVIVDTDATAALLMKRLEEGKLGRVTFMPLSQLRVDSNMRYPQSSDVTPLLHTCIEYDVKVKRAMQQVFDRKLLARSPEIATEWSSKVKMDCITLDGDMSTSKGALSGGYVDSTKSRLKAYGESKMAEKEYRTAGEEHRRLDAEAKQAEQDVANVSEEISRLQHKQTQMSRMIQNQEGELSQSETQIGQQGKHSDQLESQIIPSLEQTLEGIQLDIARLNEEIGTELTSSLTDEERALLTELKQVEQDLKGKIADQKDTVEEIRAERNRLESVLENNLYKRRTELTQVTNVDGGVGVGGATTTAMLQEQKERELEERRLQSREAIRDADDLESKLDEIREGEEELKAELISAKNQLEKLKTADNKNTRDLDEAQRRAEQLMGKKSLNIGRRDNYMRNWFSSSRLRTS
jgi:structural maintenance of chromosome 3 (chondroitin sulfate proteoglycan 6)